MLPTAIILAGGFGTRLRSVVQALPKPMAPVRDRPFLDFQLDWLLKHGCRNVILSTGHLAEKVSDHYGEEYRDITLHYSVESSPLGTGGAVKQALQHCSDRETLVLNGDSFFAIDLGQFYAMHRSHGSECSIALRNVDDASRYGQIVTDNNSRITAFTEKSDDRRPGIINAGVYIVNKDAFLRHAPARSQFSIEHDFFAARLQTLIMYGFLFDAYFIDIGIPEDYQRAQHDFAGFEDR